MIDLTGIWVTSYPSYVHDDPMDDDNPAPQLAAYFKHGTGTGTGAYDQTAGYFLASTLLCLRFDEDGTITGSVKINRGGRKLIQRPDPATGANPVTGSYLPQLNTALNIWEGQLFTIYHIPPFPDITTEYHFVSKGPNELEWIWWRSSYLDTAGIETPYRANVARGTLTRVVYPQPKETADAGHAGPGGVVVM